MRAPGTFLAARAAAKNAEKFKVHNNWLLLHYNYRQHHAGDLGWIVS
jgi:hypothetical protein